MDLLLLRLRISNIKIYRIYAMWQALAYFIRHNNAEKGRYYYLYIINGEIKAQRG
jgi:hypothetical protein